MRMEPQEIITLSELVDRIGINAYGLTIIKLADGSSLKPFGSKQDEDFSYDSARLLKRTKKQIEEDGHGWIAGTLYRTEEQETTTEVAAIRILPNDKPDERNMKAGVKIDSIIQELQKGNFAEIMEIIRIAIDKYKELSPGRATGEQASKDATLALWDAGYSDALFLKFGGLRPDSDNIGHKVCHIELRGVSYGKFHRGHNIYCKLMLSDIEIQGFIVKWDRDPDHYFHAHVYKQILPAARVCLKCGETLSDPEMCGIDPLVHANCPVVENAPTVELLIEPGTYKKVAEVAKVVEEYEKTLSEARKLK
jgi:hypothetical protein